MRRRVIPWIVGLIALAGASTAFSLAANGQTNGGSSVPPAGGASERGPAVKPPPPPPPPWAVGEKGPVDMSRVPDQVPTIGPDGKIVRNEDGTPKMVTLDKGPPPLPANVPRRPAR